MVDVGCEKIIEVINCGYTAIHKRINSLIKKKKNIKE